MAIYKMRLIEKRTQERVLELEIEAESETEALETARDAYNNTQYDSDLEDAVPDSSEYHVQFAAYREDGIYDILGED